MADVSEAAADTEGYSDPPLDSLPFEAIDDADAFAQLCSLETSYAEALAEHPDFAEVSLDDAEFEGALSLHGEDAWCM